MSKSGCTRRLRYNGPVSYRPADAAGAVVLSVLSVLASRALAAAGQGDMIWGHASVRDPQGRGVWMKSAGWGLEEIDASTRRHHRVKPRRLSFSRGR